jgi:hypothetical protein
MNKQDLKYAAFVAANVIGGIMILTYYWLFPGMMIIVLAHCAYSQHNYD